VSWNLRYWCEVDEEKPGVDSRDEVQRTEKKDLLFRREDNKSFIYWAEQTIRLLLN